VYDFKFNMQLNSGSVSRFPFDTYTKDLPLLVTYVFQGDTIIPNLYYKVELTDTGFFSPKGGVTYAPFSQTDDDYHLPTLSVTFSRPPFVRLYPMMIFILFWVLALCELLYLIPYLLGSAKSSFTNPGFYTSFLFAIPGMRNALPGAPPIGIIADYFSFFWAVLMTTYLLLLSIWHFYEDNRKMQRLSAVPEIQTLVSHWQAKNKQQPLPYLATGSIDHGALVAFYKAHQPPPEPLLGS